MKKNLRSSLRRASCTHPWMANYTSLTWSSYRLNVSRIIAKKVSIAFVLCSTWVTWRSVTEARYNAGLAMPCSWRCWLTNIKNVSATLAPKSFAKSDLSSLLMLSLSAWLRSFSLPSSYASDLSAYTKSARKRKVYPRTCVEWVSTQTLKSALAMSSSLPRINVVMSDSSKRFAKSCSSNRASSSSSSLS